MRAFALYLPASTPASISSDERLAPSTRRPRSNYDHNMPLRLARKYVTYQQCYHGNDTYEPVGY